MRTALHKSDWRIPTCMSYRHNMIDYHLAINLVSLQPQNYAQIISLQSSLEPQLNKIIFDSLKSKLFKITYGSSITPYGFSYQFSQFISSASCHNHQNHNKIKAIIPSFRHNFKIVLDFHPIITVMKEIDRLFRPSPTHKSCRINNQLRFQIRPQLEKLSNRISNLVFPNILVSSDIKARVKSFVITTSYEQSTENYDNVPVLIHHW